MRHSVSIKFMWADLSLPERAQRAAAHGFTDVELWDWRGEDMDGFAEACRASGWSARSATLGRTRRSMSAHCRLIVLVCVPAWNVIVSCSASARST